MEISKIKGAIVVTTINDGTILDGYHKNLKEFGHLDRCHFYVIVDNKTPADIFGKVKKLQGEGLRVTIPTMEEQNAYLAKVGLDPRMILANCDHRRNIGYLMAYASEIDFVISIDDDNYPIDGQDFFKQHAAALFEKKVDQALESDTHFINICEMLDWISGHPAPYARGFPYYARHREPKITKTAPPAAVHLNAGLWIGDPDVDAMSWLVLPRRSKGVKFPDVSLGRSTWTPINSQNTALLRQAIPAYYFIRMRYPLGPVEIDRYGDIFQGYFVQACCKHLEGGIRVGSPAAEHRRNSHNYMQDSWAESACIQVLEDLLPWLTTQAKLSGSDYSAAYRSLSYTMQDFVELQPGRFWTQNVKGYFHQMGYLMRKWLDVCDSL